jgi:hypothetical protein
MRRRPGLGRSDSISAERGAAHYERTHNFAPCRSAPAVELSLCARWAQPSPMTRVHPRRCKRRCPTSTWCGNPRTHGRDGIAVTELRITSSAPRYRLILVATA